MKKKCRVFLKSFNIKILDVVIKRLKKKLFELKYNISGVVSLPKKIERFNILRSPHVNKDARDQLQIITYKKIFDIFNIKDENKDLLIINEAFFFVELDWRLKLLV